MAAHFAKSDFFEDSRNVDPEEYSSFVKGHLDRLHDQYWEALTAKFPGDPHEAAQYVVDRFAEMMREYKDFIDADIEELDDVR